MAVKCGHCGETRFVEQRVGPIEDRSLKDTPTYDPVTQHISQVTYEYVCYRCGQKVDLPRP
jgi:DNA-directed RNA polymerase subunit RPC12/RpoP